MRGTTIDLVGYVSRHHQKRTDGGNGRTNLDRVTVLLTRFGLCKTNCSDRGMARLDRSEGWQLQQLEMV